MKKNSFKDNINKLKKSVFKKKAKNQDADLQETDIQTENPDIKTPEAAAYEQKTEPVITELPKEEPVTPDIKKPKKKLPKFIGTVLNKIKGLYIKQEPETENDSISDAADQNGSDEAAVNTKKNKKVIIAAAAGALLLIGGAITIIVLNVTGKVDGTAYVTPVSEVNTAVKSISGNRFSGVVESQKTYEIKIDSDKTVKDVFINDGDSVEEGDELFLYDVEAMQLDYENGELEIESLNNEIDSNKRQIDELESEKQNAGKDNQLSYTTQIQSLKTDIEKIEYDIKVKTAALEKLQNAIDNAVVVSPSAGTVKSLKTPEQMQEEGTDVMMNIVESGNFRIKGRINEQNIGAIVEGDAVIIRSRVDSSAVWKGTVSEISNEPEANNNMMYGMDDTENSSSNYAFYITPESIEGLMLGQHVLIESDIGQNSDIEKEGIWLYTDYILDLDTDEPYVWSVDNFGRLEKRFVKTGEKDEDNGDVEIVSGLDEDDLIAYPADDYQEGMKTSNRDDESIDAELNGVEDVEDFSPDDEDYDEDIEDDGSVDFDDIDLDDEDLGDLDLGDLDLDDILSDSEVEE